MNKILLVDDDRELTSLLKELLDMEGFNVLVAHDGEQALALLDDSVDLLLLDVMMPKKKRYRYAERAASDTPDSGYHANSARKRAGSRSRPRAGRG
ncbi:Copper-sensing two-component system response regulator CpxR [Klebsiella pneumoniae]|uniref:Copper-sensing two-component system response regulator CpxR n=1 Tax=Klebsiella pneumoniae TaxID=573 RepID=A0A2X3FMS4_KLEPN|nr:Copper-sensing two-component system response regulator CpxR [Klebsiella pneumoniae]STW73794.1 Copper-sensing two-component system response regulator CpxR [Klebsiella pneumoniae]